MYTPHQVFWKRKSHVNTQERKWQRLVGYFIDYHGHEAMLLQNSHTVHKHKLSDVQGTLQDIIVLQDMILLFTH